MSTSLAPGHGSPDAYANGCRCGVCKAFFQAHQRAGMPAAAPKPKATHQRRAGRAWTVRCEPVGARTGAPETPRPIWNQTHAEQVQPDQIVVWWMGTTGILVCTEETWNFIVDNDAAITCMQEAQQEAMTAMPKAIVRNVVAYTGAVGKVERPVVDPRRPPRTSSGIQQLREQIQALVVEMSRFAEPDVVQQAEFARRYGHLRDQMASYRAEFAEAEGAFEVVQARIIEFMDQE